MYPSIYLSINHLQRTPYSTTTTTLLFPPPPPKIPTPPLHPLAITKNNIITPPLSPYFHLPWAFAFDCYGDGGGGYGA